METVNSNNIILFPNQTIKQESANVMVVGDGEILVPQVSPHLDFSSSVQFAEDLSDELIAEVLYGMAKSGINIEDPEIHKDLSLMARTLTGAIYRSLGMFHPIHVVTDDLDKRYNN